MALPGSAPAIALNTYRPEGIELPSFSEISAYHLIDERRLAGGLIERAVFTRDERAKTREIAGQLVNRARSDRHKYAGIDAFMAEYGLSSEEGAILMCIAESLLRIRDAETADKLIAEKISEGSWNKHLGHSDSMFVNASTWGLMLSGRIVKLKDATGLDPISIMKRLVARSGEPVIRQAVRKAVQILGDQFVLGRTIQDALKRAGPLEAQGYSFSFDMLGEEARCELDARVNFDRYMEAIAAIGRSAGPLVTEHPDALMRRPGLSIKLSCLHPRFEPGKEERLRFELLPRVMELVKLAREQGINVCFDAEEQSRLEPMLGLFADAYCDPMLEGWHGLGIAVQAYGKRAIPVLRWLRLLSGAGNRRIAVRLVKGAYWDLEIKRAQKKALSDYPVFTRKLFTDLSYLACMRLLLSDARAFYPQFATHNAYSIAAGYVAGGNRAYEFQRLHGMGQSLFGQIAGTENFDVPCRIYAPVGDHENLLSFLLRRLLENGANTSFINRLADDELPVNEITADPVAWAERELSQGENARVDGRSKSGQQVENEAGGLGAFEDGYEAGSASYGLSGSREPILKPRATFLPEREAAAGIDLANLAVRETFLKEIGLAMEAPLQAGPLVCGEATLGLDSGARIALCPHDTRERFATVCDSSAQHIELALSRADAAAFSWENRSATSRAEVLERVAQLFERDRAGLVASIVRESGATLVHGFEEVRRAVDFLRFYAAEARVVFGPPLHLKSITGETNRHGFRGRGPFVCISSWNSPLALFTSQVAAALGAGNPVLAKPSEHTPVTAFLAIERFLEAGVPGDVVHLLAGDGKVAQELVRDHRVAGVAFTGSTQTAWKIQKTLAERRGPFIPFVAATSGVNAMIADSSALPEHVVRDVMTSAFSSSGMHCCAARVLFVQEEIAERTIEMLSGAVMTLDIGDPLDARTDIGPVITEAHQDQLDAHKLKMHNEGTELADCALPQSCRAGYYVTPSAFEIDNVDAIGGEVFGPILHVIRFKGGHLSRVVEKINRMGYGLSLSLHSRIGSVADFVALRAKVGNLYINRCQTEASVGAQPVGGFGLSGTGPQAGGPHYITRFASERVRTCDITATGGNLDLLRRNFAMPGSDD